MTKVNCPTCKKETLYSKDNPYRPFCSKRCQLLDLGDWASESHKISGGSAKEELLSEDLEKLLKNSMK